MIDTETTSALPTSWTPLYGRISAHRCQWLHIGAVQPSPEGIAVRWNEDTQALQPAWELATKSGTARGEVIQFAVLLNGKWTILAEAPLNHWLIEAVQQASPKGCRWNGAQVRQHRELRSNWPGEARIAATGGYRA